MACGTRATDEDRTVAATHQRGWREGYKQRYKSRASSAELKIEWLERRVKELEQRLDDATRVHEIAGDQVAAVANTRTAGEGTDACQNALTPVFRYLTPVFALGLVLAFLLPEKRLSDRPEVTVPARR